MTRLLAIALALLAPAGLSADATETEAVSRAQESVKSWLALVEEGKYGPSWEEAAALFQSAVTKADWEKAARSVRGPLGSLKSRKLKSATFARTLPGAPDGEYVVIQFDARFENKAAAIETATAMREKDGSWKVAGYYIK